MKRHSLGQHYLIDPDAIRLMISAAMVKETESVVEIGTGEGVLTQRLAGMCARLDGYEVDPDNYKKTLARSRGTRVRMHRVDAFSERPKFDVLVSSLPYSRSQDFVEWISQVEYNRAVVLLQEDFVRKVLSPPGSRDYRAVSAIAQISSGIRRLARVRRDAFSPPPRVNSVLVDVRPKLRLSEGEISNIKKLFSLRRREVSSALAQFGLQPLADDFGRRRVYSLAPGEVHEICRTASLARDLSRRR
ncbi:MAG TPA: rRNA adenine N-6-methyltransferase family protein [Nitrososphaerales archaeon]|nr:rRNA adenine N-6-methyltransferase family protein [Nitrososphaerales archaeon]